VARHVIHAWALRRGVAGVVWACLSSSLLLLLLLLVVVVVVVVVWHSCCECTHMCLTLNCYTTDCGGCMVAWLLAVALAVC